MNHPADNQIVLAVIANLLDSIRRGSNLVSPFGIMIVPKEKLQCFSYLTSNKELIMFAEQLYSPCH